jgi:hypothetical protein
VNDGEKQYSDGKGNHFNGFEGFRGFLKRKPASKCGTCDETLSPTLEWHYLALASKLHYNI